MGLFNTDTVPKLTGSAIVSQGTDTWKRVRNKTIISSIRDGKSDNQKHKIKHLQCIDSTHQSVKHTSTYFGATG